jgi:hypothetical protein
MADVMFILVTMAFLGLCVAYVRGLDRIVRASEETEQGLEEQTP